MPFNKKNKVNPLQPRRSLDYVVAVLTTNFWEPLSPLPMDQIQLQRMDRPFICHHLKLNSTIQCSSMSFTVSTCKKKWILAQIGLLIYLRKHFRSQNCCFLLLDQLCEWHMNGFLLNNHNFFSLVLHNFHDYVRRSLNYMWDVSPALLIFPKI